MKISNVIIMPNGLVAVFDENDNQIPALQGTVFEVMKKIERHADKDTNFLMGTMKIDLKWYFTKYHSNR